MTLARTNHTNKTEASARIKEASFCSLELHKSHCICIIIIIIIGIQPLGWSGQRPEFSQATGMALVRCILGKFLGVACFPRFLDVPTFHHQVPPRPPQRERSQRRKWELWARMLSGIFAEMTISTPIRDLLHAANLRHGTDDFTSPPKEGVLRNFSLWPSLNPRTWVLKASTLPLDHRS
jgi:hypothetical protein